MEGFMAIKPLWGFLIYAIYRIPVRIMEIEVSHHYMEIICSILTIYFIIDSLRLKETGKSHAEAGLIGFKKYWRHTALHGSACRPCSSTCSPFCSIVCPI